MNTHSTDLEQHCPDLFECMNDGCSQLRQCLLHPDHTGDHLLQSCSPVTGCGVKYEWRPDATDTQARCDQSWLCSNECDQVRYCTLPAGHTQDHEVESCPSREKCPTGRSISDDDAASHGVFIDVETDVDGGRSYTVRMEEGRVSLHGLGATRELIDSVERLERERLVSAEVDAFISGATATTTVQGMAEAAEAVEDPSAFLKLAAQRLADKLRGGGIDA